MRGERVDAIVNLLLRLRRQGQGVTITTVTGRTITGFISRVGRDTVELFVAGRSVLIRLDQIAIVEPTVGPGP